MVDCPNWNWLKPGLLQPTSTVWASTPVKHSRMLVGGCRLRIRRLSPTALEHVDLTPHTYLRSIFRRPLDDAGTVADAASTLHGTVDDNCVVGTSPSISKSWARLSNKSTSSLTKLSGLDPTRRRRRDLGPRWEASPTRIPRNPYLVRITGVICMLPSTWNRLCRSTSRHVHRYQFLKIV